MNKRVFFLALIFNISLFSLDNAGPFSMKNLLKMTGANAFRIQGTILSLQSLILQSDIDMVDRKTYEENMKKTRKVHFAPSARRSRTCLTQSTFDPVGASRETRDVYDRRSPSVKELEKRNNKKPTEPDKILDPVTVLRQRGGLSAYRSKFLK